MKPRKPVWFAFINIGGGLHFMEPQRATWNNNLNSWWHKSGDYQITKLGIDDRGRHITYASYTKSDVRRFIDGAWAFRRILQYLI